MKILHINKYLFRRDGVTAVLEETVKGLMARGHEQTAFGQGEGAGVRDSAGSPFPCGIPKATVDPVYFNEQSVTVKQKLSAIARLFSGKGALHSFKALTESNRFDIAHIHNIYHHISPCILRVLKRRGTKVVATLHDYKLFCLNYMLLRKTAVSNRDKTKRQNNQHCETVPCSLCVGKNPFEGIRHRCVKDSAAASLLCFLEAALHRHLWAQVDRFISPSMFMAQKAKEGGIPGKKIVLLRNPAVRPAGDFEENSTGSAPDAGFCTPSVLFLGRLSPEKGCRTLLHAFSGIRNKNARLIIAGEGPEKKQLKETARKLTIPVEFAGFLDGNEKYKALHTATVLCVPSIWYENCPMSILEALSLKKIVIASNIGGISEIIRDKKNGFLTRPGDASHLTDTLNFVFNNSTLCRNVKEQAGKTAEAHFNRERYTEKLEKLYNNI